MDVSDARLSVGGTAYSLASVDTAGRKLVFTTGLGSLANGAVVRMTTDSANHVAQLDKVTTYYLRRDPSDTKAALLFTSLADATAGTLDLTKAVAVSARYDAHGADMAAVSEALAGADAAANATGKVIDLGSRQVIRKADNTDLTVVSVADDGRIHAAHGGHDTRRIGIGHLALIRRHARGRIALGQFDARVVLALRQRQILHMHIVLIVDKGL